MKNAQKTVVINVVGLTPKLLGDRTPLLKKWADQGAMATIKPDLPAVTCTAQSSYLTGQSPAGHGIVGNGWYFREDCEVKFWRQSNKLVQAPKVWDMARQQDPGFTCANMFWWYNMYSSVDYSVTPRPMYPADGRKIPDIYTHPATLREELPKTLGDFPLFDFWGPKTSIRSSAWIANASKQLEVEVNPNLTLVYLPHLDYCLQRCDADDSQVTQDLGEIDQVCGDLIDFYENRGAKVMVLSEYGIVPVNRSIALNRIFLAHGLISTRTELGLKLLDPGASDAFAVADHQIAHVYVNHPGKLGLVRQLIEETEGVEIVLDGAKKKEAGLDHPRAGDLVAVAKPNAWFSYYYWDDDREAPDFARTVDIHRKPGYDPVELFIDPQISLPLAKAAWILLKKKLGFRYLMDLIPLDPSLVRGSHGTIPKATEDGPLLLTQQGEHLPSAHLKATEVCSVILKHLNLN